MGHVGQALRRGGRRRKAGEEERKGVETRAKRGGRAKRGRRRARRVGEGWPLYSLGYKLPYTVMLAKLTSVPQKHGTIMVETIVFFAKLPVFF